MDKITSPNTSAEQTAERKIVRLISESHRRQFDGEDWQAVSIELAQSNGIEFEDDEYSQLNSSPDPDCDCGFCATAPWIG